MEQIQQAMGQPIGSAADIDEDDLLNELEVLNPSSSLQRVGDPSQLRRCNFMHGTRHFRHGGTLLREWGKGEDYTSFERSFLCVRFERPVVSLNQRAYGYAVTQEMEQEQLDEQLMAPAAVPSTRVAQPAAAEKLPSAPTGRAPAARAKPKTQEEIEYDELEALQAEMAL